MQNYDAVLKNVLTRGASRFLSGLMGVEVARFLNTEFPDTRSPRADLLAEARDGTVFHIELQSTNDSRMAFRMLDYLVSVERALERIPRQLVLYLGEAPMKMEAGLWRVAYCSRSEWWIYGAWTASPCSKARAWMTI